MDLNEIIEDNIIIDDTSDYKEDVLVSDDIKKEDIKDSGIKSINLTSTQTFTSRIAFRDYLISNFNGGNNCKFELYFDNSTTMNVRDLFMKVENELQEQFIFYISDYSSVIWNPVNVAGNTFYEFVLFPADSECVGLSVISSRSNNNDITKNVATLSVSPIVGQSSGDGGSSIDYSNYLQNIIYRLEVIENGVSSISDNIISSGNGSGDSNNSQVGSVSQNILTTPINEYGLTDSLLFVGLSVAFVTLVIVVVRRLIYKWN